MKWIVSVIPDTGTVGGVTSANYQFRVHLLLIDSFIRCRHSQVIAPLALAVFRLRVLGLYARLGGLGAVTVVIAVTGTGTDGSRLFTLLRQTL